MESHNEEYFVCAGDMILYHRVGNDSIGSSLVGDLAILNSMIDDRFPVHWLGGVLSSSQIRHARRKYLLSSRKGWIHSVRELQLGSLVVTKRQATT